MFKCVINLILCDYFIMSECLGFIFLSLMRCDFFYKFESELFELFFIVNRKNKRRICLNVFFLYFYNLRISLF